MKNIPHDYYLKFIDERVFNEITEFHNKTNYVIHDSVAHLSYLHNIPAATLATLSGNELRLYPDMDLTTKHCTIPTLSEQDKLLRSSSCELFTETCLDFDQIKSLFAPIVRKNTEQYKRGYPSGGALYPTEIFLCSLSNKNLNWPTREKVLHLLPATRTFEIVQGTYCNEQIKKSLRVTQSNIGTPNLAIIYITYIPKVIFKYRYRGYRLAHLEVGSLYTLVDLMSKRIGMTNRVWSGYCDNMLLKSMGLNPTLFYPLCVQFVGGNNEHNRHT
jgi:SagB-type dehydrogenase family enzyme